MLLLWLVIIDSCNCLKLKDESGYIYINVIKERKKERKKERQKQKWKGMKTQ